MFEFSLVQKEINNKDLNHILESPDNQSGCIEELSEDDKHLIINDFNSTATDYPRDKTIAELFEEQVKRTPDNIALIFEDQKLSYSELNIRANSLAHKLRALGVKPDDFVAIIADRSIEMICGIFGIIKAGGAYVPIDPTFPEERTSLMLSECSPKVVLKYTTESITLRTSVPVIDLSESEVWEGVSEDPEIVNKPDDLIYCIYTSGTTGQPKGTLLEHHGAANLIHFLANRIEIKEDDRVLQFANYVFSASVWEMTMALFNGAALVCIPTGLSQDTTAFYRYCKENKVSVATLPPNYYIQEDVKLDLRLLITAGSESNRFIHEKSENIEYINAYGSTEITVCAAYWRRPAGFNGNTMPIGRPIDNFHIYILNGEALCGIGVPGELCITGDGLARGYLNRPELTAEKFVKNPFGEGKMYRTGDLAKWLPDGNVEYIGRIDDQVKIRGFRIELGEIESRIRGIDNIKNCAVIARTDSTGDKAIYAYYTSDIKVSVSEIKDKLSKALPEYMVPAYMMQIKEIPVNRSGKLDRSALPEIGAQSTAEYIAPRNEKEEKICNIFSEILNVDKVGVKDSFFELGGHSLRATRLINRLEAELGTRIAIKDVFAHPTAEQLAVLAGTENEEYIHIPKAADKEYYPMSSVQKRIYLIQQIAPESVTYNLPQNYILSGKVHPDRLKAALQGMIDRHEILRTQFLIINGKTLQRILDHADADFEYISSNESDEKLIAEFIKPFDLASGKLIRIKLVNKGQYHLMMLDMHHIISDGMSINTFKSELMALYNGDNLEPLTHQFRDYSEWMSSRDLSGQAEYWKSQFDDEIPVLDMPTDFPRLQEQSYAGTRISYKLDKKLSGNIRELVNKNDVTEYMIFLAAAMVTLSKYSRQEDIVIGSPISGRTHRDSEGMLGMFVNTLAMRGRPEKNKTFSQFLSEVRDTCIKAYENQEYPFDELVEAVEVQRDMSRNPIFDVMLVLQNNEKTNLRLGETKAVEKVIDSKNAKFDMTFEIAENEGEFVIEFEYCTDLFKEETARNIVKHLEQVLKTVTSNADQKISDIEMITSEEKQLIFNDFNAIKAEYQSDKTIVELFEEQVKKTPNNTALIFEDKKLTYAELNAMANSLAHKLREIGVKPDDFVAIIADRSIEMIAGIYGIIKAGGAYVPIDPAYPEDRINYMLGDCAPKAIVKYTTESINYTFEIPEIDLGRTEVWNGAPEDPVLVNKPNDLIYCIYTSGTTGKPKGVVVENSGVASLCLAVAKKYEYTSDTKVLQMTNVTFDPFVEQVFSTHLSGAVLVVVNCTEQRAADALYDCIERNKVTVANFPLIMLRELVQLLKKGTSLKTVICGGERLDDWLKDEVIGCGLDLYNHYGPTETIVDATTSRCSLDESSNIGRPLPSKQVYILNGNTVCGIGVPGELCIAGDGLARGYLNRPELTAEKFVENPFGEGKMYRSGDLARWLPNGNIEYLGRIDEQVKIRGFRIELGEIDSRIREIESIKDCAVIAKKDSTGDKAIYAYYTSNIEVSVSEIRDRLSESLPEYMVPAYMMQIDEIPVTRNGKLDKRALPEITVRAAREYVAPRNKAEEAICKAFSEILNVERVGIYDGFFELGGDSIKAIRIISKLRDNGYTAVVQNIMNGKNAEKISQIIKKTTNNQEYEQGQVTGKIENTPIIREFGRWDLTKPEHFNQAMMFPVDGIDSAVIKQAAEELVKHHDVLRAVYRNNELEILPVSESRLFDFYEYDYSNESDKHRAVEEKCNNIQKSIDLVNGPLVKVAVFELGDTRQMLLCIHHLVIDGVSWRILQEDFGTAVSQIRSGKKVKLPEKTASFIEWSKKLKEYGEQLGSKEKEYWKKANESIAEGKLALNNTGEEAGYALVEFSKDTTEKLLKKSSNIYGAKINEVLLAGLARAIGRITGQKNVGIKLEGHGREEIHEPISIDRTVGWFTNIYAVSLECCEDNRRSIINAKDTVRNVPNRGTGYGYVEHIGSPDICFNYLGDFTGNMTSFFSEYSVGELVAPENKNQKEITIDGQISEGILKFVIACQGTGYGKKFADELKQEFEKSVEELAEYCANEKYDEKTASDYGIDDMTIDEFEKFQRELKGSVDKIYNLTPLQEGMLFFNLEDSDSTGYVLQSIYRTKFRLNGEVLAESLRLLSERYDVIRTGFVYENIIEPKQIVFSEKTPEIEILEAADEDIESIAEADVKRGFDLSNDSLLRVKCIDLGDGSSKMILTSHHIIMDGWCMGILLKKIFDYYFRLEKGEKAKDIRKEIEKERSENADYSEYIKWLGDQDINKARSYWEEELSGYDSDCEIIPINQHDSTDKQALYILGTISEETTGKLKSIAEETESTLNTIAEVAVGKMLQVYSGSDDVVFGKVVSGRNADIPGIENVVGLFVNTIPLRVTAEKNDTVLDLIARQQIKGIESTNYDYCSLADIQKLTDKGADLIKVLYVFENYNSGLNNEKDAEDKELIKQESGREQNNYSITIAGFEDAGKLGFAIQYDPRKYCREEIELILERLIKICEEIAEYPDRKITEIETVTDKEKNIILNEFNDTEKDYPKDKTVVELFEEQVRKTPDKVAVIFEDEKLTFAELNAKANSVAHKLREAGVKRDDFVAIMAARSLEMIVGIYGIIKSGGAYVPIDPTYPEDRIKYMLEDCAPKAVVKYTKLDVNVPDEISVIDLASSDVMEGDQSDPELINKPEDLLYCIYTSGTTGKPKGAMIENRGIARLMVNGYEEYGIRADDVVLLFASISFDASVAEYIAALLLGASMVVLNEETANDPAAVKREVVKNNVTILPFPPQFAAQYEMSEAKTVFTSGSEANRDVTKEILKYADFINAYGPTETSVCATYLRIERGSEVPERITIGKPHSNVKVYILNGDKLCGIGVPGELCIGGVGIARGYLNRPDLTAEKFVSDPFCDGRMYRSGDLARWLPDGNIDFMGRIDEQVKIRGFRIELGEIESRIREIENIKHCVVIAKTDANGDKSLYAYYVSDVEISVSDIKSALAENLPDYMIPSYMMQIDEIPVTKNGKVDRRALPKIEANSAREYVAPSNEAEEAACNAFSEILGVERIGVNDNFFEFGGDSIKAIRIISKLRNSGYTVTVKDIMIGKTPAKISLLMTSVDDAYSYDQGEVSGKVENTPIIELFGEMNLAKPGHYNQSLMIEVTGISNSVISKAIKEIVEHHDILRAVYRNNELLVLPVAESRLFDFYEYDFSGSSDKHKALEEKCEEIQGSIDLANGPLVKAAVFELGNEKQMMLCIHHLAVDGVSWRIIREDFETAVDQVKCGSDVTLPEKTASFIEWSNKLKDYRSKLTDNEKEYWNNITNNVKENKIPVRFLGNELSSKLKEKRIEIDKSITEILLTESTNAYGAKIDEVLLAALVRAVERITGQKKLAVQLEGHGREDIHENIAIDRTVGWFTNMYPVVLDYSDEDETAIISVKDNIRSIPDSGMGYTCDDHSCEPNLCFNYLGDFGTDNGEGYSTGSDIAEENMVSEIITINAIVRNKKLCVSICCSYDNDGAEFIDKLGEEYIKSITELAEYCSEDVNDGKTLSDMEADFLDDDGLSFINSLL